MSETPNELEDQSDSWFKVARSILDHPIWTDCPASWLRVWIALLALANWAPRRRRFGADEITVQPGQVIASVEWLALKSKVSTMQARNALKYLSTPQSSQSQAGLLSPTNSEQECQKTTNAITLQTTSHGTLITIRNWERYQGREYYEQQAKRQAPQQTDNKPTTNQQQTSNNASRRVESIEQSTPLVSSGKPPEETPAFLDGMEPADNGAKSKRAKKIKIPPKTVLPPLLFDDWKALLRAYPKHAFGADIARELFIERVSTKAQSEWLVSALLKEKASGQKYWSTFGKWLAGKLVAMEAELTPEEASQEAEEEEDMRPCQPPRRFAKSS